jgi:hypothetical protein
MQTTSETLETSQSGQEQMPTSQVEFILNLQLMGLRVNPDEEFLKDMRYNLYKEGIKSACDETRIIFNLVDKINDKKKECNGLILNLENMQPLVYNPYIFQTNINTVKANKFLSAGMYNIYKIHDGTCFNLYYYNKWVIATNNGYDMNNQLWYGVSFQDAITECLAKLPNAMSWERFTDQLDKNYCYSFGFKNPKYHKFFEYNKTEIYDFWFIHSYDLRNTKNADYMNGFNYTFEQTDQQALMQANPLFRSQELVTSNVNNLKELYNMSYHAYNNYKNNIKNLTPEHLLNDRPCYGFILRSKDQQKTKEHSNLLIKSSLLRHIQNAFNDDRITKLCKQYNHINKDCIVSLYAYLKNNEEFKVLFPNMTQHLNNVTEKINVIINVIVDRLNNTTDASEDAALNNANNSAAALNNAAAAVLAFLAKFEKISYNLDNKTLEYKKKVIKEFIQNIEHFDLLISYIAN